MARSPSRPPGGSRSPSPSRDRRAAVQRFPSPRSRAHAPTPTRTPARCHCSRRRSRRRRRSRGDRSLRRRPVRWTMSTPSDTAALELGKRGDPHCRRARYTRTPVPGAPCPLRVVERQAVADRSGRVPRGPCPRSPRHAHVRLAPPRPRADSGSSTSAPGGCADREAGDRVRIHEEDGAAHVARQASTARRDGVSRHNVVERHDVLTEDGIGGGQHRADVGRRGRQGSARHTDAQRCADAEEGHDEAASGDGGSLHRITADTERTASLTSPEQRRAIHYGGDASSSSWSAPVDLFLPIVSR